MIGVKSISRDGNRGWIKSGFVILVWTANDLQIINHNKQANIMSLVIYKQALSH